MAVVPFFSPTAPQNPALQPTWYDTVNDLWKRWNGTAWIVTGDSQFSHYGLLSGNYRLRNFYSRMAQLEAGLAVQTRVLFCGTSVTNMKPNEMYADLARACGGFAGAILKTGSSSTASSRSLTGLSFTDTGTTTASSGNDVTVWHGPTYTMSNGSTRSFGSGGVNFTFDHAEIIFIGGGAGAGSLSVAVGGTTVGTIDTSQTAAGVIGFYSVPVSSRAQQTLVITATGNVKVPEAGAAMWDSTVPGIITMSATAPGLTYSTLTTQAWANFTAYLARYQPNLITWEAKGGQWSPDATTTTQLTTLLNSFNSGSPGADVILIGSTPDSGAAVPGGGTGVSQLSCNLLAASVAEAFRSANGLNVVSWDGYTPLGSWASVAALDAAAVNAGEASGLWQGDGIHLGWRAQSFLAQLLMRDLRIDAINRTKTSGQIVVADSKIQLAPAPSNPVMSVEVDNFKLDAFVYLTRMMRFRAAGSSTDWMVIDPAQTGQSFLANDMRLGKVNGPYIAPSFLPIASSQSGSVTLDLSTTTTFLVTLTGNITSWAFSNYGNNGQNIEIHFIQNSTGGWTIPTSGSGLGGGSIRLRSGFTLNTTALGRTIVKFTQVSGGYFQQTPEVQLAS